MHSRYNNHYNPHNNRNINICSHHNHKNMARSDIIKKYNMPELLDSFNIFQKKLDPTSAESSTSSQMQLEPNNYFTLRKNKTTNFVLENPEPHIIISVKKKGANIHYSDLNKYKEDNCDNGRSANYCSDNDDDGKKWKMEEGVVCSMCGDVGVAQLLFLCSKCSHRPQHIYCSRSYPDLYGEASICNWCLHEEDSLTSSAAKASMVLNDDYAREKASEVSNASGRASVNVTHPIKKLNCPAAHVNDEASQAEYKDEVLVKKGHGKAFEYLLLIAAQSLPQGISEANAEIKQANHTDSMLNITNPKMGSLDNKANCDLDEKSNMGSIENKVNMDNQANINNSKRLIMGLIPKRQRCSKGINASLKCRKKGLQLSPSRPNYRRYKLLADVVC